MSEATTLSVEEHPNGVKVIHIRGDLDSLGARTIEEPLAAALPPAPLRVLVDLSRVRFISSAGLALLLVQAKALRRHGGSMSLAAPTVHVMEVLSLAGFHELLDIYPTLEEGLAALGKQGAANG